MSTYEYWIGDGVDFRGVWEDYESGFAYIRKYQTMEVYLIRLTFEQYPSNLPLFNHEAIFKTVKGYFHEIKLLCFSREEYEITGPLFIYEVHRGSGIWSFLAPIRPLILFATTLAEEIVLGQKLNNLKKLLEINEKYFGGVCGISDYQKFEIAKPASGVDFAVSKLLDQQLRSIEISQQPFDGKVTKQSKMIELKSLLESEDQNS